MPAIADDEQRRRCAATYEIFQQAPRAEERRE